MGLYEKHKSHGNNEAFGVVIENNTGSDVYVDFLGVNNHFKQKEEGVNVYPLYKDLCFSEMWELTNWIMAVGYIVVDITKFQSSKVFETTRKYIFNICDHDANGTIRTYPCILKDYEDLPLHSKQLDFRLNVGYGTSFGMNVDKYCDMVIKFYPSPKQKTFDSSLYNKAKKEYSDFNKEKNKRLLILI